MLRKMYARMVMKKGRFIVALALVIGILVGVTSGVFMYAYSRQRVETSLTLTLTR